MKRLPTLLVFAVGLFAAPMARATTAGSVFSGPVTADASAVYWNPAAITMLEGSHVMLFGGISPIWATYQRDVPSSFDGLPYAEANVGIIAPGATVAAVTDFGLKNFRFGYAFSVPLVAGAQWDKTYGGRPSMTRYYVEDGYEITLFNQLVVAARINRFISVGVGLDVHTTMTKFTFELDFASQINHVACKAQPSSCSVDSPLPRENPALDAYGHNEGVGWSVGFSAGLLITPWPWLRLGVGFHKGGGDVDYNVLLSIHVPPAAREYIARFFPSIRLPPLEAELQAVVHVPTIVNAGLAVVITPRLEVGAEMEWHNESETGLILGNLIEDRTGGFFHDIVLPKAKRDLWQFALRGRYELNERWRLGGRLEFRPSTRAEEWISPISLDFDKLGLHFGARWQVLSFLAITLEYSQFVLFPVTVRHTRFGFNPDPTTPEETSLDKPPPTGDYSAIAFRFGLGLEFSF